MVSALKVSLKIQIPQVVSLCKSQLNHPKSASTRSKVLDIVL